MKQELETGIAAKKSKKIIIAWTVTIILTMIIFFMQIYLWSQFIQRAD